MNANESPTRIRGISRDRDGGPPSTHLSEKSKATSILLRIFFLLGAAILLPWNAMITTFPYSLERSSYLRTTYASYFSAIYQLSSFGALAHASYTSAQASKHRRITFSYIVITITLVLLFLSTFIPSQPFLPFLFFVFSMIVGALQASAGAYLLTAVVAYASYFGPLAMAAVMSGQAAVAVVVSIVQLLTTITTLGRSKPHNPSNPDEVGRTETSVSASYFYSLSTIAFLFSYIAYRRLTRMSLFRRTVARFEGAKVVDNAVEYEVLPEDEALPEDEPNPPFGSRTEEDEDAEGGLMAMSTSIGSLRERERELALNTSGLDESISSLQGGEIERAPETMGEVEPVVNATFWAVWKVNSMYNIAVMIIYIVTLAVFPAITASVQSVNPDTNPQIFTSIHFIVFNIADWIGRIICSYPRFQIWSRKRLMGLSIFRIIFVILFLACNINMDFPTLSVPSHNTSTNLSLLQIRQPQAPLVNSDFLFLVILALFGASNGWLTSLIMMAAPSLEHNKRMRKEWVDTAAVGASFSLAAGLVFGSITNFAIRGMVCSCNPFIQ